MLRAWIVALVILAALESVGAQRGQPITRPTPFDPDDIAGVVTSQNGAEAGVLVTAWTDELPTPFSRTAVTDADGRYVLPDLPTAYYKITVHGDGVLPNRPLDAWAGLQVFPTILVDMTREEPRQRIPDVDRGVVVTAWDWGTADTVIEKLWRVGDNKDPAKERIYGMASRAGRAYWLDPRTNTVGETEAKSAVSSGDAASAPTWVIKLSRPVPFFTPYTGASTGNEQIARISGAAPSWKEDGAWMSATVASQPASMPAGSKSKVVLVQRRPAPLAR